MIFSLSDRHKIRTSDWLCELKFVKMQFLVKSISPWQQSDNDKNTFEAIEKHRYGLRETVSSIKGQGQDWPRADQRCRNAWILNFARQVQFSLICSVFADTKTFVALTADCSGVYFWRFFNCFTYYLCFISSSLPFVKKMRKS